MLRHSTRLFLLLAASLCAAPAQAEVDGVEMALEELVNVRILSTPKFAENADAIPSVVSILKREDIRLYGWRTLGDALRSLQGFNVTSDHTYGYVGVRGISPPSDYRPRLQVLIDGMAVNENIYASVPVDSTFPLDLDLVERIEVVRGPSASVYGGDAMFGVINVVTRSGESIGGIEGSVSFGSGRERHGRLTWGAEKGETDWLVSATGFDSVGRGLTMNDVAVAGDKQRAYGVGAENGGQVFIRARGTDWRFTLIHSERDRTVTNGSYGTIFNDRGHVESDRYSLAEFAKDWQLNAKTTLHQRFYVGEYGYDGLFPYDYSPAEARAINRDKARGDWWGFDNRLVSNAWTDQRWSLGLEYKFNTRQYQANDDIGYGCYGVGSDKCLNDSRQSRQFTLYLQDEIRLGTLDLLTLGLRYDNAGNLGSFPSVRLGFVHDAQQFGMFKLLYGTAFRTPSVYERFYTTPVLVYGNPDLQSEKMRSLELSWEKHLSQQSRLSAALYHFNVQRLGSTDTAGIATNGNPVNAIGLEVEFERHWANRSQLRMSYTTQYAAADEGGWMDNSPRHMLKANLAVPTGIAGLMAGIEAQYLSDRRTGAGSAETGSYALTNLNLGYAPAGQFWDASLGIYNLFDRHYSDPIAPDNLLAVPRGSMPQLGRSVQLKTNFHF
jgi:outer membrane cobalamin receptor